MREAAVAKQDVETLTGLIWSTLKRSHPDAQFNTVQVQDGYDRDGVDTVRVFLTRSSPTPLPDDALDEIAYEIEAAVHERDERFASVFFPDPV